MRLHDINVLIYALRKDSQYHELSRSLLLEAMSSPSAFAVTGHTLCGFVRIVTDRRIFPKDPTPLPVALAFAKALHSSVNAVFIAPGGRHWTLVEKLCERTQSTGAIVSDAYLAALALENGCELVTFDRDYARFPGLTWRHPLDPQPMTNPA
jgi:toxin-antitoxin system PIN domain toxin